MLLHFVERSLPADLDKFSLFIKFALGIYAQKRLGNAIGAVHDLGVEIAFDAV